jgi:hypothetical protein
LKQLKVGDTLNMRFYKTDLPEPSDYMKGEIKHITKEARGRFRGHYLIGLAVSEECEAYCLQTDDSKPDSERDNLLNAEMM